MSKTYDSLSACPTRHPVIQEVRQAYLYELLAPLRTTTGEVLPAGTVLAIGGSGMVTDGHHQVGRGHHMSVRPDGRQVQVLA